MLTLILLYFGLATAKVLLFFDIHKYLCYFFCMFQKKVVLLQQITENNYCITFKNNLNYGN